MIPQATFIWRMPLLVGASLPRWTRSIAPLQVPQGIRVSSAGELTKGAHVGDFANVSG
jgi:hypothetical protein